MKSFLTQFLRTDIRTVGEAKVDEDPLTQKILALSGLPRVIYGMGFTFRSHIKMGRLITLIFYIILRNKVSNQRSTA
jgi:hypothetical protein